MKLSHLSALAIAAAATTFAGSASAIPIDVVFNVNASGFFTADTASFFTTNTITDGSPNAAVAIVSNNVNLVAGQPVFLAPTAMGVKLNDIFTKTFTTSMGTFVETLKVTLSDPSANALGVLATGMIHQTVGTGFDDTAVFWSAAYTKNAQGQINGSFNNSTVPPPTVPEPASLALVGMALAGLGLARRRRS